MRQGGETDFKLVLIRESWMDGHDVKASPEVDPEAAHVTETVGINPIQSVAAVLSTKLTSVAQTSFLHLSSYVKRLLQTSDCCCVCSLRF